LCIYIFGPNREKHRTGDPGDVMPSFEIHESQMPLAFFC